VGAPYIDDVRLAAELNGAGLPGVRFVPVRFMPAASVYAGKPCGGVNIILTDREQCRVVDVGLEIAETLARLYPQDFHPEKMGVLLRDPATLAAVKAGESLAAIHALWQPGLDRYQERREKCLRYP